MSSFPPSPRLKLHKGEDFVVLTDVSLAWRNVPDIRHTINISGMGKYASSSYSVR